MKVDDQLVWEVSILVVLDDALVQAIGLANALAMGSLNPCCAGRCSSTL